MTYYAYEQGLALAGDVGKGNLASVKTTSERVVGETPLQAGLFVALNAEGVRALNAKTDTLAGVVVRSVIKNEWKTGELLDVMHIAPADAIWVHIVAGEEVSRGDKVYVASATSGEKIAGAIQGKKADDTIATDYHVIQTSGNLALITKL